MLPDIKYLYPTLIKSLKVKKSLANHKYNRVITNSATIDEMAAPLALK